MAAMAAATNFSQFPTELITLIERGFSQWDLYQCSLVNKNFHHGTTPLMWRTAHLYGDDSTAKFITSLREQQQGGLEQLVRILDVQNGNVTNDDMLILMKYLTRLERLFISMETPLDAISFQKLPAAFPNLTTLYLVNSPIPALALDALGDHCPHLRAVTLHNCTELTATTFAALRRCMADLLVGFPQLTHVAIFCASPLFVIHLLENAHWPRLTHVRLDVLHGLRDDQGILAFIRAHPRLTCLDLSDGRFTDVVLNAITNHLPRLMFLDVCHNPRVRRVGVDRLVKRLQHLCFVHLTFCGLCGRDFPELGVPRHRDRSGRFALSKRDIKILQDAAEPEPEPPRPWISPAAAARAAAEAEARQNDDDDDDDDNRPGSFDCLWWREDRWMK
ncbi:unnamed protein product [Absidia cylindrospora]